MHKDNQTITYLSEGIYIGNSSRASIHSIKYKKITQSRNKAFSPLPSAKDSKRPSANFEQHIFLQKEKERIKQTKTEIISNYSQFTKSIIKKCTKMEKNDNLDNSICSISDISELNLED